MVNLAINKKVFMKSSLGTYKKCFTMIQALNFTL